MEIVVVEDAIEIRLRTYKDASPYGVTQTRAGMYQEVSAVHPRRASRWKTASRIRVIKKHSLSTGAGHKVRRHFLGHMPRVHAIHVVDKGPVFLKSVVERSLVAGHDFSAVAKVILEGAQQADIKVGTGVLWRGQKRLRRGLVFGGKQLASPHSEIKLLRASEIGQQKQRTHRREQSELSQSIPLGIFL